MMDERMSTGAVGAGQWISYRPGKARVLLREPEKCWECGKVYISLYPLKHCSDHDDLERLHS